jgi:hypothetical protein
VQANVPNNNSPTEPFPLYNINVELIILKSVPSDSGLFVVSTDCSNPGYGGNLSCICHACHSTYSESKLIITDIGGRRHCQFQNFGVNGAEGNWAIIIGNVSVQWALL